MCVRSSHALISRRSQALAKLQSRSTVACERPIASAVSSIVKPANKSKLDCSHSFPLRLRSALEDVAKNQFGDRLKLHIRGSFVDLSDLGVAVVFLGRIVFRIAVTAV